MGIAAVCTIEIYNIHSVKFCIIYVPVWIYAVEFMVVISAIILQKVKTLKLMDAAAQPIIQVLCSSQYEHASNR